ncbi:hypothetical protein SLE2022_341970 [Rubroshorea leprosula]
MLSSRILNPSCDFLPLKRVSSSSSPAASMALLASPSLRFESLARPPACRVSVSSHRSVLLTPRGLGVDFRCLDRRISFNQSIVAFAASHEEPAHSEVEVEKEKEDLKLLAEESEEAWKQTLASFKEQALKMQSVSQEAYEIYYKKATIILKETSEQLKIQAERARNDLTEALIEISEEGIEYISTAAENYPEPVKEIVETFSSSTVDFYNVSKLRDFHLGIPYGLLLSVGGFLSFMVTGSLSAIRFGVILGGALLALSISSLRLYRRGKRSALALKGQAAIAAIIFLRELCFLSQELSLPIFFTTSVSGAIVAFYIFRIMMNGKHRRGLDLEPGAEN